MIPESYPTHIGRYKILTLLGEGAMGKVWLAEDPLIKRKVAVKTLRLDLFERDEDRGDFLARFSREAEISGVLNDPGIVTIYDVGESELGPFLAMEYVKGESLDYHIKSGTAFTLFQKLRILAGTAKALDLAHAAGIIHRDVKPGNVMILESGRPKLMDFGIAKQEDSTLTQTGTFMGTPSYVSPEQVRGNPIDSRSDLFSFAVMTFEMLTGILPFPGNSINTILYNIVNEPPVKPPSAMPGILPDRWNPVFNRALAKEAVDRHPTCVAFVQDLLHNCVDVTQQERQILGSILQSEEDTLSGIPQNQSAPMPLQNAGKPVSRVAPILVLSALGVALVGVSLFWVKVRSVQAKPQKGAGPSGSASVPIPAKILGESTPRGGEPSGRSAPAAAPPQANQVPPAGQGGTLRIVGTFPVRVRMQGQDVGESGSGKPLHLPLGTHQIELSAPKVFFKETRTVHILEGIPSSIFLPALVRVRISTSPEYGFMLIDGIPTHLESTGGETLTLAAGSHTIGFEGKTTKKTLEIRTDGLVTFALE